MVVPSYLVSFPEFLSEPQIGGIVSGSVHDLKSRTFHRHIDFDHDPHEHIISKVG